MKCPSLAASSPITTPWTSALLGHAAQEALSNAFQHAQPTEITIRLAAVYHGIRLTVITAAALTAPPPAAGIADSGSA